MRTIHHPKTRAERRQRRHHRVRSKVSGTEDRPRISVYRSLKHIYVQLVDDTRGKTLVGVSDLTPQLTEGDRPGKVGKSFAVGKLLAEKADEIGVKRAVFDRSGYAFHGRVKAVADGARKGGLEF